MNEEQVLIARLQDLAKRAYRQNIYTYSGFLTPAELAVVYEKQADFSFVGMTCFGGTPECERQMVQHAYNMHMIPPPQRTYPHHLTTYLLHEGQ